MSLRNTWYIGAALLALARNLKEAKGFCKADLLQWSPELASRTTGWQAIKHLQLLGFIKQTDLPRGRKPLNGGLYWYAITLDGIEAAKAAQATARSQKQAKTALAMSDSTRASSAFAARLWSLVRLRQQLTAIEAAELLTDAGDDIEIAKVRAASYLRTWAKTFPDALQVSAKRISRFKRYVLTKDLGPSLPKVSLRSVYPKKDSAA